MFQILWNDLYLIDCKIIADYQVRQIRIPILSTFQKVSMAVSFFFFFEKKSHILRCVKQELQLIGSFNPVVSHNYKEYR